MLSKNSKLKTNSHNSNLKIRINKFLAQSGFGSRRGVEILIKKRKVKINKKIAKLSDRIDPSRDIVEIDEKIIKPQTEFVYYAVNKPVGYTSTTKDINAEKLVTDLVPKEPKVFPVGRLDKDSRGLIILTNDGDVTNQLTHPKYKHEKEYIVRVKFQDTRNKKQIDLININKERNIATVKIVLHQGWKRQIRRMCEANHLAVTYLQRIRINKLKLDDIKEGDYKIINRSDII